jgi:hypothetical protein
LINTVSMKTALITAAIISTGSIKTGRNQN